MSDVSSNNLPKPSSRMLAWESGTCRPIKGEAPLTEGDILDALRELPDWSLQAGYLLRECRFKNYYQTMAFVNAVAWIAHQQDHHPDLEVYYNRCVIRFRTHSVDGITENDFICASQINRLQS